VLCETGASFRAENFRRAYTRLEIARINYAFSAVSVIVTKLSDATFRKLLLRESVALEATRTFTLDSLAARFAARRSSDEARELTLRAVG